MKQRYVAPDDILGLTELEYGKILLARGQPAQAEPHLRAAWENLTERRSVFKWTSAEAKSALGQCLAMLGKSDEASPLLDEGLPRLSVKSRTGARMAYRSRPSSCCGS